MLSYLWWGSLARLRNTTQKFPCHTVQPLLSPIHNHQILPSMAVLGKRKARSEPSISKEDAAAIFRRHFEAQFAPLPGADVESKSKATKRDDDEDATSVDSDEEDDEEEGSEDGDEWGGLSDDEQSEEEEEEGESRKSSHGDRWLTSSRSSNNRGRRPLRRTTTQADNNVKTRVKGIYGNYSASLSIQSSHLTHLPSHHVPQTKLLAKPNRRQRPQPPHLHSPKMPPLS